MSITKDDIYEAGSFDPSQAKEIELRGGIRSLYYGAFHEAHDLRDVIPHHSSGVVREGSHEKLIGFFSDFPTMNSPVSQELSFKIRAYGIMLSELKKKRVLSDYDLGADISIDDYRLQKANLEKLKGLHNIIMEKSATGS